MTEASVEGAVPMMSYSPGETAGTSRVMRGLLIVGAIHGGACALYVVQRAARWIVGTETELEQSQAATAAGVGLCLQVALGVGLAACCMVAMRWPSPTRLRLVSLFAAVLAAVWYAYGAADVFPSYQLERMSPYFRFDLTLMLVCRESNQAIVCALLVYACRRERLGRQLARLIVVAVVLSCVLISLPTIVDFLRMSQEQFAANSQYYTPQLGARAAYITAGLLVAFMRKWWRIVAALPLLVHLLKTYFIDHVLNYQDLAVTPTFASVMQNLRSVSFLLVVANAWLAGFVVFTVLGVPRLWSKPPAGIIFSE